MMPLRVLTYNLNGGEADRLEAIHGVLAHAAADVVALTEADDRAVVEALAGRLGMHHVWAPGSGRRNIATLSRWPVVGWRAFNSPPLTQAVLETELAVSPGGAARVAGSPLIIYNIHLLPFLLLPFEVRRWQAVGRLLEVIAERRPGPHLIAGDLNAVAAGDRVLQRRNPARMRWVMMLQFGLVFRLALPRLVRAGYVDCFRKVHPAQDGFTWMPGNRTTRYDYILADPALAGGLRDCRVVDEVEAVEVASDHLPLMAEFAWP